MAHEGRTAEIASVEQHPRGIYSVQPVHTTPDGRDIGEMSDMKRSAILNCVVTRRQMEKASKLLLDNVAG